jgi:hypothetical protein
MIKVASTLWRAYGLDHERVARASVVLCKAGGMERIAPIFAVCDLEAAMAHYQRLGFNVRVYRGGDYAFASWNGIEIHLGVVPEDDRRVSAARLM